MKACSHEAYYCVYRGRGVLLTCSGLFPGGLTPPDLAGSPKTDLPGDFQYLFGSHREVGAGGARAPLKSDLTFHSVCRDCSVLLTCSGGWERFGEAGAPL